MTEVNPKKAGTGDVGVRKFTPPYALGMNERKVADLLAYLAAAER